MTLLVALVCLALGIALGWFGHRKWGVGAPTPTPIEPPEPEALADAFFQRLRATTLAERKAEHDDWDTKFRKLCKPENGVVWQRDMAGAYVKWPDSNTGKKHNISDFNN